jgi:5-carboxymethyl-2-hydroxymuconate isomerase
MSGGRERSCHHWWTKVYSRRSGSWLNVAIACNLDKDGNVALNFEYKKGRRKQRKRLTCSSLFEF